jgi:hypothetical protein
MKLYEFVQPEHNITEAKKPRVKVFTDGSVEINGRKFSNIAEAQSFVKEEIPKAKGRFTKIFGDIFSKNSVIGNFAKGFLKRITSAVSLGILDLAYTGFMVGAGKKDPKEMDYAVATSVAFVGVRLIAIPGVKLVYSAAVKGLNALKFLRWASRGGRALAVGSVAATAASGGTSAPVTFWTALGGAASWVGSELLLYLGTRTVVTMIMKADEPAFERAKQGSLEEAQYYLELMHVNEAAEALLNGNTQESFRILNNAGMIIETVEDFDSYQNKLIEEENKILEGLEDKSLTGFLNFVKKRQGEDAAEEVIDSSTFKNKAQIKKKILDKEVDSDNKEPEEEL